MSAGLRTSPLHDRHLAAGAKLAPFAGWAMPLEYAGGGVLAEHTAVREAVGLFDVSHLGAIEVRGPGAADFLNRWLTGDLDRVGPGQAQYTLLCDDRGGVVDDLICYRYGAEHLLLVPNAANAPQVLAALAAAAPPGVTVADRHTDLAVLALQGPRCDAVLVAAGLPPAADYLGFVEVSWRGRPLVVCRTGYTGERGYELLVAADDAGELWDALVAVGEPAGLRLAGLGARDTLRTEMGYPLHGQDLSAEITPVQARLSWAVGWHKPAFAGRQALLAERAAGPDRVLRGLRAVRSGIPRPGMAVQAPGGDPVGTVTSGTFSPTLRTGIGLALVTPDLPLDADVAVLVRDRPTPFRLVRPPFVPSHVRDR